MNCATQLYEIFLPSVDFGGLTLAVNTQNVSEQYKLKGTRCLQKTHVFLSKYDDSY